ncbi:MAG: hypothetical protein KDK36_03845, partial [Leptospiraceae bacterium]|nr:hypothetical protein [Leptospiraceae bacterium]
KARDFLLRALKHGPDFFLNHLYIAKIYKSLGDKKKTKEHLEWIMNANLTRKYERENTKIKNEAEELLKRIK